MCVEFLLECTAPLNVLDKLVWYGTVSRSSYPHPWSDVETDAFVYNKVLGTKGANLRHFWGANNLVNILRI